MKTNCLLLVLKAEWYNLIKKGIKCAEYREHKPYWSNRILKNADKIKFVQFQKGYSTIRTEAFPVTQISSYTADIPNSALNTKGEWCGLKECRTEWGFNPEKHLIIIAFKNTRKQKSGDKNVL
jgi:hypothetical protein